MKDYFIRLAFLIIIFIILPLILIYIFVDVDRDDIIDVYNHKTKKVVRMSMDEYLIGVVASEMPANFEKEALKSQAVAARTYALKRTLTKMDEHFGADICTDFSHCQAYMNKNEMKEKWGKNYRELYNKIKSCIRDTNNQCLMYEGEYATAVFHSCSNEKTENASDVWGGEVPYLVSVESPGDVEKKDYITEITFSREEFDKIISDNSVRNAKPGNENVIIGQYEFTQGNNIAYMYLYGEKYTGVEIRKIFSLKSSAFDLVSDDNYITFTVYGNGHGVGMSQYGAQSMAKSGKGYKEILSHYYPGTQIDNMYK